MTQLNPPEPAATDPYAQLAAELHKAADQLATLAGRGLVRPRYVSLHISTGLLEFEATKGVPAVNAIAAALETTASTNIDGRGDLRRGRHQCKVKGGLLQVEAHCDVPIPPTRTRKVSDLQRENAELRARLAAQGGAA